MQFKTYFSFCGYNLMVNNNPITLKQLIVLFKAVRKFHENILQTEFPFLKKYLESARFIGILEKNVYYSYKLLFIL